MRNHQQKVPPETSEIFCLAKICIVSPITNQAFKFQFTSIFLTKWTASGIRLSTEMSKLKWLLKYMPCRWSINHKTTFIFISQFIWSFRQKKVVILSLETQTMTIILDLNTLSPYYTKASWQPNCSIYYLYYNASFLPFYWAFIKWCHSLTTL